MRATCWHGVHDVRVEDVPDPGILNPHDGIVKISSTAICGSDLHLYDGYIPTMMKGDILGHEFMGEVVETGPAVVRVKVGDRVVIPFTISCGHCSFCKRGRFSACDNTNPNASIAERMYGYTGAGLYGYSHMMGGYAGGQAEYARVPFIDIGALNVPQSLADEQVLFLSDIYPTGYMAAENCNIQAGDTIAVWGCGPVGQFAIRSALLLGAERVIAIDSVPERLRMAASVPGVTALDDSEGHVFEIIKDMTGGIGPNACIDAVGMEAHGTTIDAGYDKVKQAIRLETDRGHALRQAIRCCAKGGTVSIPGVYSGFVDKFPIGVAFAKGLTFRMGQTHMQKYMRPCLERIERGEIDPSFVITHRFDLDDAPAGYQIFREKQDECIKIVMKPN